MLAQDKRQEFKDFLNTVDKLDATLFLAEYLAEKIVIINGNGAETIKVITNFKEELISQVNERI